jgi:hypothetical protein
MIDYDYNGRNFKIIPLDEMRPGVYKGKCRNAEYAYSENEYRYDVFLPFEQAPADDDNVIRLMNAINGAIQRRYEP